MPVKANKLYELDAQSVQGKHLPKAFLDTVYVPDQVRDLLGITTDEFWLAIRAARIPPAVWLPTETPAPVWDRAVIDLWISQGCPVSEAVFTHNLIVLKRLCDCVQEDLGTNPPTANERN